MMYNIFIDGKEGTTGLQIYDRLAARTDINLITLPEDKRKDYAARKSCLNEADISFLCLPDAAAREAVSMVENPSARIIDASTAHRTAEGWVYGLPEISDSRRQQIATAKRVANPGCHATGFITLAAPLVKGGIAGADYPFTAHSVTGYSGGGKKTIAEYKNPERDISLSSPRQYATAMQHKHLPEMVKECGLKFAPAFNPIICDFYCGMCVVVPLTVRLLIKKVTVSDVYDYFAEYYATQNFIKIAKNEEIPAYLPANELSGTNMLKIYINGSDEHIFLASVFDNLGKGASGAAVQNMNIMLGLDERTSLI
ncbi:MAG: N-acetyl-gamma-glutamyl-phosphate reductase [Clostridia bacterium]|nr:N-acetyl-gamma-glutamyl-phosphate reductase [Clostridia bacterium]